MVSELILSKKLPLVDLFSYANGDFLGIIGDTSTINKTSKYDELIKAKFIICFDHHRNGIDIKHDLF